MKLDMYINRYMQYQLYTFIIKHILMITSKIMPIIMIIIGINTANSISHHVSILNGAAVGVAQAKRSIYMHYYHCIYIYIPPLVSRKME